MRVLADYNRIGWSDRAVNTTVHAHLRQNVK